MGEVAAYHESGLVVREGLTFEEWTELGNNLTRIGESVMWWIGDWALAGERLFGEEAAQALPMGYSLKTVQNAMWVAQAIPPSRRVSGIPFGHHSAVAALPATQADALLAEVVTKELRVPELRQRVREVKGITPKERKTEEVVEEIRQFAAPQHFVAIAEEILSQLKQLAEEMMADGAAGWGIRLREILEPMGEML